MEESKVSSTRTIRCFEIGGITSLLVLLVVLVSFTTVSAQPLPDGSSGSEGSTGTSDSSRLLAKAQKEGSVRAIVGLRTDFTPEGRLSGAQVDDQRAAIESAEAGLRSDLAGTGYETLREYETVPYMALELTPEALRAVQNSTTTTTIQEDVAVPPTLAESGPIVQAPIMWENDLRGGGKTIAVLDTGVDRFHPFLGGRVVEEACFSEGSDCPNGERTQTGYDSGAPCTYAAERCQHGTHVAGIAAGQDTGTVGFSGVAPNANIMSVQVYSRHTGADCTNAGEEEDPCTLSSVSDQIKAMERVYQLRNTRDFAAVNLSLGAGRFNRFCDSDSRKAMIDNLRAAGIATVIASGNDGYTDAVAAPACISSAITVGNTTDKDTIAANSNFSGMVDLLAPGTNIVSSVPGGNFASKSGTSMAAPHVAGAWALLEERYPFMTVNDISYALKDKGKLVKDTRAGASLYYSGSRINIAESAFVRPLADDFASPKSLSGATFSVNGINEAATREIGEPDHLPADGASLGENSVWYSWTAPFSGPVTLDTCQSNFDTALAVYTGSGAIDSLSQVASDNDSCSSYNDAGSQLSFDAVAGRNYRIAVAGYSRSASEGTFTLTAFHDPPSNDYFFGAQEISGNSATVEGTTLLATREPDEPDHYPDDPFFLYGEHSVWYSWTAPSSGQVEMDTCTANISSTIALYTGSELGTLSRVASNTSYCPSAPFGSKVTFEAVAGTTYKIAVAEPASPTATQDTFTLKVTGPTPPIDTASPSVVGTSPANNATGVLRGANVRATFSEAVQASTINTTTFRLRKSGTTTNIAAALSYDPATKRATLNPNVDLKAGATYVATVTTGAKDLAGNQLDQDPNTAGNQPKSWQFKVQ
jgi:subtilisin family serine protease